MHFKVSPRSAIRLSSTFSYAFTDLIDNFTKDGVEGRRSQPLAFGHSLASGQQATRMYGPEENATRLAIGQSQAMKLAFRQLATYIYNTEESATRVAIGHLRY